MPRVPLEVSAERSPLLEDSKLANAFATVGTTPAAKFMYVFREPWWERVRISGGYSITDLPIKRIWYLGTEGRQPEADAANTSSLLMIYNDVEDADYWAAYQSGHAFRGPPEPRPTSRARQ